MANKLDLQEELTSVLNGAKVYLQPPESVKLIYPCAKIELDDVDIVRADNRPYMVNSRYSITYITKSINDDPTITLIENFMFCSFDRMYKADNLYHFVFTIYY